MKTLNSPVHGWLGLTLRDCLVCLVLLFLTAQQTFGQSLNYSTTVNSTSGPNYSVTVALELTAIVPVQNSCQWGYNYDVVYNYNVQINGSSTSLYTLAGYLTCGANSGIYFDLPNNGGAGNGTTQGNPWTNNTDCATATLQSMQCASIDLQIEGPGIPLQTITLTPTSGGNGGGGTFTSWTKMPMGNIYTHWTVIRNGVSQSFSDTVFLDEGQQLTYELNY